MYEQMQINICRQPTGARVRGRAGASLSESERERESGRGRVGERREGERERVTLLRQIDKQILLSLSYDKVV